MTPKQISVLIISVVSLVIILAIGFGTIATNDMGWYHIRQNAFTGTMSIRQQPGPYPKMWAKVSAYQISDQNYFSKHDEDGGRGIEAAPIQVRFNDGGTALISGSIKYRFSTLESDQLKLHEEFKTYPSVKQNLVRQIITEALMQTATFMKAEESYSTRRSEFTALAEDQIRDGIYATVSEEKQMSDAEGNDFVVKTVKVKMGENGTPLIRKTSPFKRYNIEILQFVIKDIDFDKTIDNLITKKKEAEQQKVVAKANAERAKQDAITAFEQGQANIAIAKAKKEVEKIEAVTEARKQYEVEKFEALKAKETAKKIIENGRAEAAANRAKVSAGLTPQEKAEWDYKKHVDGLKALSDGIGSAKWPTVFVAGGNGKGGSVDPITALGIKSMIDISNMISK